MGVDPNYQGVAYGSALLYAAGNGHLEIVTFLIEKGANVNRLVAMKQIAATCCEA